MGGKTNKTATLFSQKKLLAKSQTGVHRADNQEPIPSGLQVAAQSIFSQDIPSGPTQTLYTVQSASMGKPGTIEYVDFVLQAVTGSTYDANDFDPEAQAQSSGPHTYRLVMTGNYEELSGNPNAGTGFFVNDQILHWSLGGLQLVPPTFSNDAPNPYLLKIYSGSRDVDDQIPILDELDWQVDYYSGLLFIQDYDSGKIPSRARGFIYVGDMLSASLGTSGGGGGTGVGWFGSAAGSISTTGSIYVGTSTTSNPETFFSSVGAATFNEQGRNADFRVEGTSKTHAFFIDASENQVLILSGGGATSTDEASGKDVNFYVSGTVGGRGGATRSISLFGGDLHISGNLTVGGSSPGGGGGSGSGVGWIARGENQIDTTGSLGVSGSISVAEYIRHIGDDDTYLRFQSDDVAIQAGGRSMIKMTEGAQDQVLVLSGGGENSLNPKDFADANFFVSGAVDSRGTSTSGTSVFGGDVAISGTLAVNLSDEGVGSQFVITTDGKVGIGSSTPAYKLSVGGNMDVGEYIYHKNDANTYIRFQEDQLHIKAGGDSMIKMKEDASNQVLILSGGNSSSPDPDSFSDTNFFVSGAIDSRGSSVAGTAVFGGDMFVSGTAHTGHILPAGDSLYDLGSSTHRFANIYTGDLHLRNERGHWQIVEEAEFLTVINRLTGKRYKMMLEPMEENE